MHDYIKLILDTRQSLFDLATQAGAHDDLDQERRFIDAFELLNVALLAEAHRTIEHDSPVVAS